MKMKRRYGAEPGIPTDLVGKSLAPEHPACDRVVRRLAAAVGGSGRRGPKTTERAL
jgi:hypothetical protein